MVGQALKQPQKGSSPGRMPRVKSAHRSQAGIYLPHGSGYSSLTAFAHPHYIVGLRLNEEVEFKIPGLPTCTHSRNTSSP